jgi:FlaA1/EpsC-like NDP-sugar epimerase
MGIAITGGTGSWGDGYMTKLLRRHNQHVMAAAQEMNHVLEVSRKD